jgi:serine/threonine protein kinase
MLIHDAPQRFSILVVDDNAVNRLSLSRWLEKEGGYRVTVACDGVEALRLAEKEPFDLVVLDLMMPVLGGQEVLRRLRETYKPDELPVIMATARDKSEDVVAAFDLGANDYIVKPVDYPVALARVRAQLRSRARARRSPRPLSTVTTVEEVRPGMVLDDKYRLEERIGEGAHGTVFRATHLPLNRDVAVKVLRTNLQNDPAALEQIQQEGVSACRVEHPNAVAVLDFTATRRGLVFLVLELLRGHTLQEELRRAGRLSPERAAEILFPVCDVLTEAHSVGILHRDVKPHNTFLHQSRRGEVVKVLDFGLAKLLEGTAEDDPTLDGLAGTLAYIAPERVTAEPYDGRADVYSLGVMLYEMLAGRLPYAERTNNPVQMMMMHVRKEAPPLSAWVPEIDPRIERVVLAALEKNPRKRPTAAQLKARFAEAMGASLPPPPNALADQSGYILQALLEQEMSRELEEWRDGRERGREEPSRGG